MSAFKTSDALLNTALVRRGSANPELVQGYLDGTIPTKGPSRSRSCGFEQVRSVFGTAATAKRHLSENQRAAAFARRRKRGGDGRLPHDIRCDYSEGQRAALSVIGEQVAKRGRCEWKIEKIATVAGVSIRTVQYAIRRAERLGHLFIRERRMNPFRNLTNVITVALSSWLNWLRPRRKTANPTNTGCKAVHGSENRSYSERPDRGHDGSSNGLWKGKRRQCGVP